MMSHTGDSCIDAHCEVCTAWCTVHTTVHCTVNTTHLTLFTTHCKVQTTHCTVNTTHCTVCTFSNGHCIEQFKLQWTGGACNAINYSAKEF